MNCVVCNSKKTVRHNKVVKCETCSHVFRDYGYIDLDHYYTHQYRKNIVKDPPKNKILTARNMEKFKLVKKFINNEDSFLEVGFGRGHFYEQFTSCNKKENYYCCEINSNLAKETEEKGINVIHGSFQNIKTNLIFDIVGSFDVLEHFENPFVYKQKLLEVLKPNGLAIIQVPIERKLHSRLPFDGHYHYFSDSSLRGLMKTHFSCESIIKTEPGQVAGGKEMIGIFKRIK